MRNLLPVSAAAAAVVAASLLSAPAANAMVGSSAAPLQAAIDHSALTEPVRFVCRFGPWGRRCVWVRGPRFAYGFHPGWRRHWWGWRRWG